MADRGASAAVYQADVTHQQIRLDEDGATQLFLARVRYVGQTTARWLDFVESRHGFQGGLPLCARPRLALRAPSPRAICPRRPSALSYPTRDSAL